MDRFPLGFWNYPGLNREGPESVKDWDDAGMTLSVGPHYNAEKDDKSRMLAILDAAQEKGIKIILMDSRCGWKGASTDPEGFRRRFQQVLDDFGSHPALYGFYAGDEPDDEAQPDAIAAMAIEKEMAPDLVPFLNHLPFYPGAAARVGTKMNYDDYLVDFCKKSGARLLCYDCYSQMDANSQGIEGYFTNLKMFHDAAEACNIPWWTTLLSVGHFRYRCPKEDDFRWQLYTALASGCNGILWFFFYSVENHNFRISPIDSFNERSETFEWLSRIQRMCLKREAPYLLHMKAERVYHVNRSFGGYPFFVMGHDELFNHFVTTNNLPIIATVYKHEDGSTYCSVVNNSQTESTACSTHLKGEHRVWRIDFGPKETELISTKWGDTAFKCGNDETVIDTWLAPGQMELYRVE